MRAFKFSSIFAVLLAAVIATAGVEVSAQGKGKGRGGEKHGGGQRAERGGGHDRGGRSVSVQAPPASRVQASPGWQNRGRGNDKQKDRASAWQGRGNDRSVQVQQQRVQQQQVMQQQRQIWQAQRGGNDNRRGRGGDRVTEMRQRQIARQPQIIPAQKWRFPQVDDRRAIRDDRRRDRGDRVERLSRSVFSQNQAAPPFSGNWKNYGQYRKAQVHQRNAERKALKEIQRQDRNWDARWDRDRWSDGRRDIRRRLADDSRRYAGDSAGAYDAPTVFWPQSYAPAYSTPTYRTRTFYDPYPQTYGQAYPYSYDNGYSPAYYGHDDRPSGADILRNVIFAVLGGVGSPTYDNGYYPQYDSYQPAAYYDSYSPQYAGYNSPYYPANYSYGDAYYDPYLSQDPYYGEVLPVEYFVSNAPGGGLFRQLFGQLLAIGYDQGYRDGVSARRIRERDREFYDPYAYDNTVYDPYSVSLGYNRRCLSQGYELGYEDALNNVRGYDQFQHGDVDLVSVLVGTVSQLM